MACERHVTEETNQMGLQPSCSFSNMEDGGLSHISFEEALRSLREAQMKQSSSWAGFVVKSKEECALRVSERAWDAIGMEDDEDQDWCW